MAELFESLSAPDPFAGSREGNLVQAAASDLSRVASRAAVRQQSLVERDLAPSENDVMAPTPRSKKDKTGLGAPSGQIQGLKGVTNTVSNASVQGASEDFSWLDGEDVAPVSSLLSQRLVSRPEGVEYADLSPVQKSAALRHVGLEADDFAVDPETKKLRRSSTGAAVLAFKSPVGEGRLFIAEDGAPAHSALMQAVKKVGLRAAPVNGRSDYDVGWQVHPEDRKRFLSLAKYFEPGSLKVDGDMVQVAFTDQNNLNRSFIRAPFGSNGRKK